MNKPARIKPRKADPQRFESADGGFVTEADLIKDPRLYGKLSHRHGWPVRKPK